MLRKCECSQLLHKIEYWHGGKLHPWHVTRAEVVCVCMGLGPCYLKRVAMKTNEKEEEKDIGQKLTISLWFG